MLCRSCVSYDLFANSLEKYFKKPQSTYTMSECVSDPEKIRIFYGLQGRCPLESKTIDGAATITSKCYCWAKPSLLRRFRKRITYAAKTTDFDCRSRIRINKMKWKKEVYEEVSSVIKMPGQYFDKKELINTPSAQDGIDYKTEMRYRKEGARLIINTGSKMDLGYNTMATGVVYYHRFYMFHSFKQFPRYVTACCCLFLAGKVEETPKKCKDIIKTARSLLTDQQFTTFGEDPKEEVMTLERILLQTIKFDLQVEHPYQYLLKYAKCLKGDKEKLHKMVQMAWTFVNDSLCTTLVLQWEPEIIAVALIYLAGKLSKFELVDWIGRNKKHCRWWDMFVEDITLDLLEDICHQVLDVYSQNDKPNVPDSPTLSQQKLLTQSPTYTRNSNGQEKQPSSPDLPTHINLKLPPASEIARFPYQTFTRVPSPIAGYPVPTPPFSSIPAAHPLHMAGPPQGPPPHINAPLPSVFPYVNHLPPLMSSGQPPFFPAGAPPPNLLHRPFYPPLT